MSASTNKINPPFRADHIGSLKRPDALLAKRKEFDDGKCSAEELKVVEDEAVTAIVKLQREVGIKSMTDGEFRRYAPVCIFCLMGVRPVSRAQAHVLRRRL